MERLEDWLPKSRDGVYGMRSVFDSDDEETMSGGTASEGAEEGFPVVYTREPIVLERDEGVWIPVKVIRTEDRDFSEAEMLVPVELGELEAAAGI